MFECIYVRAINRVGSVGLLEGVCSESLRFIPHHSINVSTQHVLYLLIQEQSHQDLIFIGASIVLLDYGA